MIKSIPTPNDLNRVAKILLDSGEAGSAEEAESLLAGYAVSVLVGEDAANCAAGQAALLSMIVAGRRALLGGVFVDGLLQTGLLVRVRGCKTLAQAVDACGGKAVVAPAGTPRVRLGYIAGVVQLDGIDLQCFYDGWRGGVAPYCDSLPRSGKLSFAAAGVLAGAIAISEVFLHCRGGYAPAGRRAVGMSLWNPASTENWMVEPGDEPKVEFLPTNLWVIGLGHLGQAYLWTLAMLPYSDPTDLHLVLQDFDRLNKANCSTSVLTEIGMEGRYKTREMAAWADQVGFKTSLIERKFDADFRIQEDEPPIALAGVDNSAARAALEGVGFKRVIDAGLGAGPTEFQTVRLYTFPGPRKARTIWGKPSTVATLSPQAQRAYRALREAGLDQCGLTLLAEKTVGAPFVGLVAASLVVGEVVRGLHGAAPVWACDLNLRSPDDRYVAIGKQHIPLNPGFCMAAA
jgi:hypothetical protein